MLRAPRFAGVRADYDRVLRQRNALLKSASARRASRGGRVTTCAPSRSGTPTSRRRRRAAGRPARAGRRLRPLVAKAYDAVADRLATVTGRRLDYRLARSAPDVDARRPDREAAARRAICWRRSGADPYASELERGVSLVGPHRDDLVLELGPMPAKGYASHGESWSFALALRLAAYDLLRAADGGEPVLVLDDVFAELDDDRRDRLAGLVGGGGAGARDRGRAG